MKIVLAQPSYQEIYEEIGEPVHEPPLGLLYIATCLKKEGHEVEIYDLIFRDQNERFWSSLSSANYVGLTVTSPLYPEVMRLCASLKKFYPNVKVVLGGPHISALPAETLKNQFVDYVIAGEGEYSMCHLVKEDLNFSGIGYKQNGNLILNPPRLIDDLHSIPFPERSLIDIERYSVTLPNGTSGRYTTVISTRGCPFGCCFCDSRITFGRKTRFRSPQNVIAELIDSIKNYGITNFGFLDDTTTLDQQRFEKICDLIIEQNLSIHYHCSTRVDCINEELLRKMKRSGCYRLHIGCESGEDKILRNIGKRITTEQIINCFKLCKKVGISTYAYFIIGLAGDTEETILKTIDFATKIDPDFVQFTIAMPFPGTDLYQYATENHLFINDVDYDSFKWYGHPVFFENVEPPRLIQLQKLAYTRFYRRPRFIMRQLESIRSPHDIKMLFDGFQKFRRLTKKG